MLFQCSIEHGEIICSEGGGAGGRENSKMTERGRGDSKREGGRDL